ncbi:hypothetical protein DVH24_037258 [Malus domestica]|uniref:Uncharacterized protein n=1 Tax=Malus domestica TaxID=3750 RepID=A0A498HGM7_MALDO|nr:hypothetical protein DVH24_037258 [Malus domestica]
MASATKLLSPFRKSLSSLISSRSSISPSRQFYYAKFEPVLRNRASTFHRYFNLQNNSLEKFWFSGSKLRYGSIIGVTVLFWSVSFLPNAAYAMEGQDMLVNDHNLGAPGALDVEEDRREFRKFMRKLWLPFFFCITALACWDHHITPLGLKLALFLLSTKPNPLSVYVFVEEPLFAHKVEVEDFKLLCLAKVEVQDQKFTLVGILGGWWHVPTLDAIKDHLVCSHKAVTKAYT